MTMAAESSKQATGYPPVTEPEEEKAAENAAAATPRTEASRLGTEDKVLVDAIAAVVDQHRGKIDKAALEPETKRYTLDLLDALFLDLLQTVLTEAPTLEVSRRRRRAT